MPLGICFLWILGLSDRHRQICVAIGTSGQYRKVGFLPSGRGFASLSLAILTRLFWWTTSKSMWSQERAFLPGRMCFAGRVVQMRYREDSTWILNKTRRWRSLIRKTRKAYKGRLSYSANWDHYKDIEWWRDLDLIGMTVYYDLVGEKKPKIGRASGRERV